MKNLTVSWIQGKSQKEVSKNLDYYSKKIVEASQTGTKLIVLPELFLWNYFPITEDKTHFDLALTIDSNEIKHFQKLAKDLKVVLVLPVFEKRSEGIFHNSALIVESNGEIIGHYRKMHIPDDPGFYEKFYFTPGDLGFLVTKTSVGNLGVLICWDQWFPEGARATALKGADILIYPTAIGWDDTEIKDVYESQVNAWTTIMRSHSISNGVYVLAVNRVGKEGHLNFWGNSFISDPYGNIIHQDKTEEIISSSEINFSNNLEARKIWPFFRDRRVDKYSSLLKVWDN